MRRFWRLGGECSLALGLAWACALPPTPAFAAAWMPEEGHGEAIVATLFDQANAGFDQTGRFVPTPQYKSLQASLYVDYGVTDWLAALVHPSLQSASLAAPENQHFTGLGDSEIGARALLWRDEATVLSLQTEARPPTGVGPQTGWLPGARHADFDFRALLGKSFALGGLAGFVDLEAAYRLRGGPAPNETRAEATLGIYATPDLMLLAQNFNILSGPSHDSDNPRWSQSKAQLSLVYRLNPDWRIQAGGFATLAGRNALRENGALVALWRGF